MSGNVTLLVRACVVYVRPVLEYNSITWSPHLKQDIMMIEKVQRRFTKRLRRYRNLRPFNQTCPPKSRTETTAFGSYLLLQNCFWTHKIKFFRLF